MKLRPIDAAILTGAVALSALSPVTGPHGPAEVAPKRQRAGKPGRHKRLPESPKKRHIRPKRTR